MAVIAAVIGAVAGAIGTAATAIGTIWAAGGIGATFLKLGLAVGINALASTFLVPDQPAAQTGIEATLQLGSEISRGVHFGEGPNKGHRVYDNQYGNDNEFTHFVFVLSEAECEGLVGVNVNGEFKTLTALPVEDGEDARYAVDGYEANDAFIIRFYSGKNGQVADQELIDTANPAGRWNVNSRLTGMSYVSVRLRWDDDLFGETGVPDVEFILKGAKLYDFRKDSTNGGSGSHRWDDRSTWEYSDNPVLIAYNGCRGIEVGNGHRVFGLRMLADDFDNATLTAAANACDEAVALDAGGTEKRYRAFVIGNDEDVFRLFLTKCLNAMSGFTVPRSGRLGFVAGVAQTVVDTVTDKDLAHTGELFFDPKNGLADLVNRVHGQFRDPTQLYKPIDYPAIISTAAAAEDGQERGRSFDLTMITSPTQAQRCAKIRLLELRQQASAVATFGLNKIKWEAGDWITWNSDLYEPKTYRIAERRINAEDRTVTVVLDEITAPVYDWATSEEGEIAAPPAPRAKGTQTNTVTILSAVQAANDGTILEINYTPITDPTVTDVIFELREINTDIPIRFSDPSPGDGVYHYYNADPAKRYEVRAMPRTDPPRSTVWSGWSGVLDHRPGPRLQPGQEPSFPERAGADSVVGDRHSPFLLHRRSRRYRGSDPFRPRRSGHAAGRRQPCDETHAERQLRTGRLYRI